MHADIVFDTTLALNARTKVAHYFRLAKEALASFTGPTNMEVAK